MLEIKKLASGQFEQVRKIAFETWPVTYKSILSSEQLAFMLDLFYSIPALEENLAAGHTFLLATIEDEPVGFASFQHNYKEQLITRIPKIYVLPRYHGNGIGKVLIEEISKEAESTGSQKLSLNVNRNNPAIHFYSKMGFNIVYSEDIEIGNGYLMEDYVMEKTVATN